MGEENSPEMKKEREESNWVRKIALRRRESEKETNIQGIDEGLSKKYTPSVFRDYQEKQ